MLIYLFIFKNVVSISYVVFNRKTLLEMAAIYKIVILTNQRYSEYFGRALILL